MERIADKELHVCDTKCASKGLIHSAGNGVTPFIRAPRKVALSMTGWSSATTTNSLCLSLSSGYNVQRSRISYRGKKKKMFTDLKYVTLGCQANRAARGVTQFSYHSNRMNPDHWNNVVKNMKLCESVMNKYLYSGELNRLREARKALSFPTMKEVGSSVACRYFGGISYGVNLHLECHTDDDSTYSIITVHIANHHYILNDRVICYFCFPRLGVAVALRPGDILVFNAHEPHCISSRCDKNDTLYVCSLYHKTSIVGLNDNSLILTESQNKTLCHS